MFHIIAATDNQRFTDADKMNVEEWKRQRKWTVVNGCLVSFTFGLSLTIYYPTEFYYFRDTMKVPNPDFFYGLGWAFLCGSGVLSSLIGSYYADKTKNVRGILIWTNIINLLGNIMYLLHYSPYIVLTGQLLVGTAAMRMVAIVGEISRIYESVEITHKVAFLGIFSSIGSLLGPCSTFLFTLVDLHVGKWVLNVNNFVGVLMGGLCLVQLGVHYLTIVNLSQEFNMKKAVEQRCVYVIDENGEEVCETATEYQENTSESEVSSDVFRKKYLLALRSLVSSKEVMVLYALSFFCTFGRGTIILLLPIKSSLYLGWMQTDQATYNIISASAGAIPTAIVLKRLSKTIDDFYLLVYAVATLLLISVFMAALPIVSDNRTMTNVLTYIIGILYASSTAGFHIMSRSMLAKFVPENVQTVTEAIRNSLFEVSYLVAGLCVRLPDTHMTEFMATFAVLIAIGFAWLLVEADRYKNIQVIPLESEDL